MKNFKIYKNIIKTSEFKKIRLEALSLREYAHSPYKDPSFKDFQEIVIKGVPLTKNKKVNTILFFVSFYSQWIKIPEKEYCCIQKNLIDLVKKISPHGSIQRVFILFWRANSQIPQHVDSGPYHEETERYHIVISGDTLRLFSGDEIYTPRPLDIFWFNNHIPHGGFSEKESVEIIFDIQKERKITEKINTIKKQLKFIKNYKNQPIF